MPMVKQPLSIEHALLGFVRQRPMHGYEIHQRLIESRELGMVWSIKQSLLYAYMARLEEEGLLSSQAESGGKQTRRLLTLTPAGEQAFIQWVRSPVEHGRDLRIEFLAKIYFAEQESPTAALELVARQRWATRQRLSDLTTQAEQAEQQYGSHSYEWLVLRYRIGQLEAILVWLDTCTDWLIQREAGATPPISPGEAASNEE